MFFVPQLVFQLFQVGKISKLVASSLGIYFKCYTVFLPISPRLPFVLGWECGWVCMLHQSKQDFVVSSWIFCKN